LSREPRARGEWGPVVPFSSVESLPFVERVLRFERIDSTNTYARELPEGPSGDGLIVVTARRQGAGRGQRGNTFFSDTDTGLWVSVVVQLESLSGHFAVNRALAMAACGVVGELARLDARIKWPNDILVGERKLAGILLESVPSAPGRIVAGIGMNVNTPLAEFPADLRAIATSLHAESGARLEVEAVLVRLLRRFQEYRLAAEEGARERYRLLLSGVGREARIGGETGVFEGVSGDGRACLRCGGETRYFSSGPLRFV
jgi:BirA family transcriptional regulator, biotin operon repressor / biotin---[acetyl-CoA-carboxylase] ligase